MPISATEELYNLYGWTCVLYYHLAWIESNGITVLLTWKWQCKLCGGFSIYIVPTEGMQWTGGMCYTIATYIAFHIA